MTDTARVLVASVNWPEAEALAAEFRAVGFEATAASGPFAPMRSLAERAAADAVVVVWTPASQSNEDLAMVAGLASEFGQLVSAATQGARGPHAASVIDLDAWSASRQSTDLTNLFNAVGQISEAGEVEGAAAPAGAVAGGSDFPTLSESEVSTLLASIFNRAPPTAEDVRDVVDLIGSVAEEASETGESDAAHALLETLPPLSGLTDPILIGALSRLLQMRARLELDTGRAQAAAGSARIALEAAEQVFLAGDPRLVPPLEVLAEALGDEGAPYARRSQDIRDGVVQPERGVLGEADLPFVTVPVMFATNRALKRGAKPWLPDSYSARASRTITYGQADVSVERDDLLARGAGELDDLLSAKFDLAKVVEGSAAVSWLDLEPDEKRWVDAFAERIGENKEALLYVHGFSTTLERGLIQAGRLAVKLGMQERAVALYSWPSAGCFLLYGRDRSQLNDASSAQSLARVIRALAERVGEGVLNVVAHSLGSQFLLDALTRLAGSNAQANLMRNIVFASPDLPLGALSNWDQDIDHLCRRITVYASRGDRALAIVSSVINQTLRQGATTAPDKEDPLFDTVDTTAAPRARFGHSDYLGPAIHDVRSLIWAGLPPQQRPWIRPSTKQPRTFRLRRLTALGRKLAVHVIAAMMARSQSPDVAIAKIDEKLGNIDVVKHQQLAGKLLIMRRDIELMRAAAAA